jgi:hypothetical protein
VSSVCGGPKVPIGGYEFLETECPVESAWIGQDPDFSATEPHELSSPVDSSLSKNSCKGRLTQKRQVTRAITPKLSLKFPGGFVEIMTRELARAYSRSLHRSREAASILKNRAVVFWLNQVRGKARPVKDAPKSVIWAREMMPRPG